MNDLEFKPVDTYTGPKRWIISGIVLLITASALFLVFNFKPYVQYKINGDSMLPTLHNGDIIYVNDKLDKFYAGDVVIVDLSHSQPQEKDLLVKRVIAEENDKVDIDKGMIYVNGKMLIETYIDKLYTYDLNPDYSHVTVPAGCVYVLGDNRSQKASLDSRSFGPVNISDIKGKFVKFKSHSNEDGSN